jgi:hypothetical protein
MPQLSVCGRLLRVRGSTSGEIAGAVARSFAQHGAKLYVTARNLDAAKALAKEIKADGGNAEAAKVDAQNETEIDNFLQKVVAENGKLDVVFNGIAVEYSEMGGRPLTTVKGQICQSGWDHCGLFGRRRAHPGDGRRVGRAWHQGHLYLFRRDHGDKKDRRMDRLLCQTARDPAGTVG